MACLGQESDFPTDGELASGMCALNPSASVDDSLNSMLLPYASTLPSGDLPTHREELGGVTFTTRGIVYLYDSEESGVGLQYYLKGNQSCPRGDDLYIPEINSTACLIVLQGEPGT